MAEDSKIILDNDQTQGTIQISPRVLEIIAGYAASEVDGVSKMYGSFANSVSELLGRSDHRRGVKLVNADNDLVIDVDVYVEYGVSVPKVAAKIQKRIKQQVTLMTNLEVAEVNVHVKGVVALPEEQQFDPDNLFGDDTQNDGGKD
ncbi:MAG: Asp23/Gls24 family envelope stress response protein [Limosilactobacillus sp.]|uniref:Asp23/Gls24 family envelope stress response protein n=1 Tax=Limosilactobacillus sp. TaxID=2773925 RepID=UPI0026F91486|nr:Asp23/Gls24 family envelope stress response protein [Limosilactobacillus sp.]